MKLQTLYEKPTLAFLHFDTHQDESDLSELDRYRRS